MASESESITDLPRHRLPIAAGDSTAEAVMQAPPIVAPARFQGRHTVAEAKAEDIEGLQAMPNGPAAAAAMSAGLAIAVMGVLFTVSHSRHGLAEWLQFKDNAGAVSGLSTVSVAVWLGSWALLSALLWNRTVPFWQAAGVTMALIVVGLVLTTPPIVQRIEL